MTRGLLMARGAAFVGVLPDVAEDAPSVMTLAEALAIYWMTSSAGIAFNLSVKLTSGGTAIPVDGTSPAFRIDRQNNTISNPLHLLPTRACNGPDEFVSPFVMNDATFDEADLGTADLGVLTFQGSFRLGGPMYFNAALALPKLTWTFTVTSTLGFVFTWSNQVLEDGVYEENLGLFGRAVKGFFAAYMPGYPSAEVVGTIAIGRTGTFIWP